MSFGDWLSKKAYRAGEMVDLIARYAADRDTRQKLFHIFVNLAERTRYDDIVDLRLRINNRIFPIRMRWSDIFIIGEILHEQQYRLQSRLGPTPIIVDLGANIGISVLWFLAHWPKAEIHAFEPARDNLTLLEANIRDLPEIRLERAAVGAKSGQAILRHAEFGGEHSLLIDGAGERVLLVGLADYMATKKIAKIDLLKVDIEGAELDALKGLGDRITDVDVIIGEVHETLVDETEFYRYLTSYGFRILWRRSFQGGDAQQVHGFEAARTT